MKSDYFMFFLRSPSTSHSDAQIGIKNEKMNGSWHTCGQLSCVLPFFPAQNMKSPDYIELVRQPSQHNEE